MQQRAQTNTEFLEYATSMLQQLRDMARSHNLQMLSYLIDMASIEAAEGLAESRPSTKTK